LLGDKEVGSSNKAGDILSEKTLGNQSLDAEVSECGAF
jgi:hypothetical protein